MMSETIIMNKNKQILFHYLEAIHDEVVEKVYEDINLFNEIVNLQSVNILQRFGGMDINEMIYHFLSEYYSYKQNLIYFEYAEDYEICEKIFFDIIPTMKSIMTKMVELSNEDPSTKMALFLLIEKSIQRLDKQLFEEYGE